MPIKKSYDEIINKSNFKTLGEIHDMCDLTAVHSYTSPRSGKNSIKLTFKKDGIEFNSFMGLSEKAVGITNKTIVRLLTKSVGEEKAKDIFEAAANDEDVNDEATLAEALSEKLNKKLKASPIEVYVDRVKEGDFWNVKWRFDRPGEDKPLASDEFWSAIN